MGARVMLEMVRLEPNRIEKMALLDTRIHGLKEGELEKRQAIIDYAYEYGMVRRQDLWSLISQHEDMQNCIKGSVLEIIEDAGHFAPCEQPQHTAASLVPFLAK